jgi:hypothetical protein
MPVTIIPITITDTTPVIVTLGAGLSAEYSLSVATALSGGSVVFSGPGTYELTSIAALLTNFTLTATGGANLVLDNLASVGNVTNLVVDGPSTINIGSGVSLLSAVNASFGGGGGGTLILNEATTGLAIGDSLPTVTGFGTGDHIDFGTTPITTTDKIVYTDNGHGTGGTLTLETSGGTPIGLVTLVGSYTQADFTLGTDGVDFACFLHGTHILTENGEVPVEHLKAGDKVATLSGVMVEILAVRRRSFSNHADLSSPKIRPVCIAAGALAENVPHRDLYVSPDHSMYLNDHLVPAQLLVNGETITQDACSSEVAYYHIEIAPHDVIIAEGAASESYLDIGNRSHFAQPGVIALFPESDPKNWEDACAPLLLSGPQLTHIQNQLWSRAMAISGKVFAKVA